MEHIVYAIFVSSFLTLHKSATANFRKLRKAQRLIKRRCFRALVCRQLDLTNGRITLKNCLNQSRPDTFSLFFRKYQKILNKNDRNPIANGSNNSKQFFSFIRRQHQ